MNKKPLLLTALLLGLLGIAIAVAQETEEAPQQPQEFTPTQSIPADQGVAFPVDI